MSCGLHPIDLHLEQVDSDFVCGVHRRHYRPRPEKSVIVCRHKEVTLTSVCLSFSSTRITER
jgi:hypothetical protein